MRDSGKYVPFEPYALKARIEVSVSNHYSLGELGKAIKETFKDFLSGFSLGRKLKIHGIALNGEELMLQVGENTNRYGGYEYDDYIEALPKAKWKNYIDCEVLNYILSEIKKYTHEFGRLPNSRWRPIMPDVKNY